MTEPNRACTTYDCIRVSEIIGPVNVVGALTALDDVIVTDLFFIPEGGVGETLAFIPVPAIPGGQDELVFGCVDDLTGEVEPRIIFACPSALGTNPALCIPDFAATVGVSVGFVGYDADGCFVPVAGGGIVELVCAELAADPECVETLGLAILAAVVEDQAEEPPGPLAAPFCEAVIGCGEELFAAVVAEQELVPPGPLAVAFCDAVEGCLEDIFLEIAADTTTPLAVAFCDAVEACLADVDFATLLACADLNLGTVNVEILNQTAICVEPAPVVASLSAKSEKKALPKKTNNVEKKSAVKPLALPPVIPPEIIVNRGAGEVVTPFATVGVPIVIDTTALTTFPLYTLETAADTAYQVEFFFVAKSPTGDVEAEIDLLPTVISLAGEAVTGEFSFLINNVGGTITGTVAGPVNVVGAGSTITPYEIHVAGTFATGFGIAIATSSVLAIVDGTSVTFVLVNPPPNTVVSIGTKITQSESAGSPFGVLALKTQAKTAPKAIQQAAPSQPVEKKKQEKQVRILPKLSKNKK